MKKISIEYIIRYAVLTLFLILFSVFSLRHFILGGGVAASVDALCPFGGFETLFTFITTGGFVPRILMSSLVLSVGVLITVLLFRRGFCGYICPFGTVQELLGMLTKKKMEMNETVDKYARWIKYAVLIAILIGTAITGTLVFRGYDPFMAFFHFGKGILWNYEAAEFLEHIVPFTIMVIVLTLGVFIERFWCKYLCPLGAVMGIFTKLGLTKIERDGKSCNGCGLCNRVCPMKIKVSCVKKVSSAECINCNKCVDICPKKSLTLVMLKKKFSILTYVALLVGVFLLVVVGAKLTGIWMSVPGNSLSDDFGVLDAESIKGWMTLNQIASETGIDVEHFIQDLGLPDDIDRSTPVKDVSKKYNIEFETSVLREYVENFEYVAHHVEEENIFPSTTVQKEIDCPWGIRNDPYPGKCGLYRDGDSNGICDLSE